MDIQPLQEETKPLSILLDNWQTIAKECTQINRQHKLPINRENKSHLEVMEEVARLGHNGWIEAWGPTRELWWNYGFCFQGQFLWENPDCTETIKLLAQLNGIKVAALSLFRPGMYLLPHKHEELGNENAMTFHLGLEMADKFNYLHVEDTFVQEFEGKAFTFDGSKTHYAYNFSERDRLILYLEFYPDKLSFRL